MTTPNVPLRMEMTFELPGTPEQVWQAIATGEGISSWFLRTDLDEREGGVIVTHMGPDMSSAGTVTGWDPPRRLAYEEPDWAGLAGRADAPVTPLATEFLVEARSGGTSVVRVVSSAFGVGADWEQEFFTEMERSWRPFFDHLRLYLAHFPGQRATVLEVAADIPGAKQAVTEAMRQALAVTEEGQRVDIQGITGSVERVGEMETLVRLEQPCPGYMGFFAFDKEGGVAGTQITAYLFSDDAPAYVERETPAWKSWLEGLAVPAA